MAADHRKAALLSSIVRADEPEVAGEAIFNLALAYAEAVAALRAWQDWADKNQGALNSVCTIAHIHGVHYSGESFTPAYEAARAIIAQLPEG